MSAHHVRHGFGTVRPYIYGPYELPEFLTKVFGAEEIERHEQSERRAAHVELKLGDSVLVVEAGAQLPGHELTKASIYVYVEDVDGVYQTAVEAGAESIAEPEDKVYGERGCGFKAFENTWWVSTYTNRD
ncbi:MAG: VOC family protein [Gammaproteobacteria bacterium]|nr:VOC family protein [Gammaproteobacteria bacterium]